MAGKIFGDVTFEGDSIFTQPLQSQYDGDDTILAIGDITQIVSNDIGVGFSLDLQSGYVTALGHNITGNPFVADIKATGWVDFSANVGGPIENRIFYIRAQPGGSYIYFYWDSDGSISETDTLRAINFVGGETPEQMAALLETAIQNSTLVNPTLTLNRVGARLNLESTHYGTLGNDIAFNETTTGTTKSGSYLTGGTDGSGSVDAVMVGRNLTAGGDNCILLGKDVSSAAPRVTALGYTAVAYGGANDSVMIGSDITVPANAHHNIQIGTELTPYYYHDIFIGHKNQALGSSGGYNISIGYGNKSYYEGGVVIGRESYVGDDCVAIGSFNYAVGFECISIGRSCEQEAYKNWDTFLIGSDSWTTGYCGELGMFGESNYGYYAYGCMLVGHGLDAGPYSYGSFVAGDGSRILQNTESCVVIGDSARVEDYGIENVAIGTYVRIYDEVEQSVGIGEDISIGSTSIGCVAIGTDIDMVSDTDNCIGIGRQVDCESTNAISVGYRADIGRNGVDSIAIGRNALVQGGTSYGSSGSVAIGAEATVYTGTDTINNNYCIAIGFNATIWQRGLGSIAIGKDADIGGGTQDAPHCIAIGEAAKAWGEGDYNLAFGYQAQVGTTGNCQNHRSMAMGYLAEINNTISDAIAIGTRAEARATVAANDAVVIGRDAYADNISSVVIGPDSWSVGAQGVAVGTGCEVSDDNSIAVGNGAEAKDGSCIAIGKQAITEKWDSIAIGEGCQTHYNNNIAIGNDAIAGEPTKFHANAIAIGQNVDAFGNYALAIGINASTDDQGFSTAIGYNAKVDGQASIAMGFGADADASAAIALGMSCRIKSNAGRGIAIGANGDCDGFESIALGYDATVASGHDNSVALGSGATTTSDHQFMLGSSGDPIEMYTHSGIDTPRLRIRESNPPSAADDTGIKGDICWDSGYIYICVDTDTWVRAQLATWS